MPLNPANSAKTFRNNSNSLAYLTADAFLGMDSVKLLSLKNNHLTSLPADVFTHLLHSLALVLYSHFPLLISDAIVDLRGSKFFQFHAVFENFLAKSYVGAPCRVGAPHLWEMLDPPLNAALCWLKEEELNGMITWFFYGYQTTSPRCAGGVDWLVVGGGGGLFKLILEDPSTFGGS